MNKFDLLDAFGAAGDEQLRSAGALLGYEEDIMHQTHKKTSRTVRAVLLIAAVLAALGITAYAAGVFGQHFEQPAEDETVTLRWSVVDPDGSWEGGDIEARNLGLVISYDGAAESEIEFRACWLPEGPKAVTYGGRSAKGFCSYIDSYTDDPNARIPYQISVYYAYPGYKVVVPGKVDIVRENTWDELEVTEFIQTIEYGDNQKLATNFVLLFSPEDGWMISVGGAEDFETLERIARELDVRKTGVEPERPDLELNDYTALGVGRG